MHKYKTQLEKLKHRLKSWEDELKNKGSMVRFAKRTIKLLKQEISDLEGK